MDDILLTQETRTCSLSFFPQNKIIPYIWKTKYKGPEVLHQSENKEKTKTKKSRNKSAPKSNPPNTFVKEDGPNLPQVEGYVLIQWSLKETSGLGQVALGVDGYLLVSVFIVLLHAWLWSFQYKYVHHFINKLKNPKSIW